MREEYNIAASRKQEDFSSLLAIVNYRLFFSHLLPMSRWESRSVDVGRCRSRGKTTWRLLKDGKSWRFPVLVSCCNTLHRRQCIVSHTPYKDLLAGTHPWP